MKRIFHLHFLLTLAVLGVAGLIIWPGCAMPSFTTQRMPLSQLRKQDFKRVPKEHAKLAELEARLGKPDAVYDDLNVACYRLSELKRRQLWLFLGVLPIAAPRDVDRIEVALIQFDPEGNAQRVEVKSEPMHLYWGPPKRAPEGPLEPPAEHRLLRQLAERWVKEGKSPQK